MGEENWQLISISEGKMYWSKKKTTTRKNKTVEKTPEFEAFRYKYRSIKKNGLYDPNLPAKFQEKVKEFGLDTIMNNLDDYIKHCKVKEKPEDKILMPSTYLTRNRFTDDWDLWNVTLDQKRVNTMLKEQVEDNNIIDAILQEKRAWEATNTHRELTSAIFQNIIDKYNIT